MGKGDKRSEKGKRWIGSYGKSRPKPGKTRREQRAAAEAEKKASKKG